MVKAVLGRVYPGHKTPKADNYGYTIDELKELANSQRLIGKPIWLEHREPAIGEINRAWVDPGGFLCVWADLFDAARLDNEELYNSIQRGIKDEELKFFSIHWIGQRDSSGVVIQDSKTFLEASLTTEPAYEGTSVFSQAASKGSNTAVIAHGQGKVIMDINEVQAMLNENGLDIDANMLAGYGPAQIGALIAGEVAKARDTAVKETESKLAPQASMTDTERSRLEELEKREEQREKLHGEEMKRYAERESKNVDGVFEVITHMVPEEDQKQFKEDLAELAASMSAQKYWAMFKMFREIANQRQTEVEQGIKIHAKLTKDNTALMKEMREMKMQTSNAEQAQTPVEQAASKRSNVGFDPKTTPKRQKSEKKSEEPGEKVEEEASALKMFERQAFPLAFGTPKGYNMEDESARNFLAFVQEKQQSMTLGTGLPMIVKNDFIGSQKKYNTRPF
jgi:phage terminase small subunit